MNNILRALLCHSLFTGPRARLLCLIAMLLLSAPAWPCTTGACVSAGPRLASVDSTKGPLLNLLLGGLLGSGINLSVADWNALAQGNVNALDFLNALKVGANVSTPSQALTANVGVLQAVAALRVAAQGTVNANLVNALGNLEALLPGVGGTIRVVDLLGVTVPPDGLSATYLNALNMVTGLIQLHNHRNVLTTPTPISVSGASLGLGGLLNSVQLSAQAVEPPVYVCGPAGTTFHTAVIRVKLRLSLIALDLNVDALTALLGTGGISLKLVDLELYLEVGRAEGVIAAIDAVAGALTVQSVPGVADLYLGSFADNVFFNRTRRLSAADLGYSTVAALTLLGATVAVDIKSAARGDAPFATTASFSGPYPQTRTVSTSAAFAANLLTSLVGNLDLRIAPKLALVNDLVLPVVKTLVVGAVGPLLGNILGGLVDPMLKLLGIGLGEMDVTVNGICQVCALSGTVYNDANRNSLFDGGESGLKKKLNAKLIANGVLKQTAAVDPATGAYSFAYVPAGTYSLIVDSGDGNGVVASAPGGWVGTEMPSLTRSIVLSNSDLAGMNFGLYGGNTEVKLIKTADRTVVRPGEAIVYTVAYRNDGAGGVTDMKIVDATPAYTVFGTATCGPLPAGISACQVSARPEPGLAGSVEWTLTGTLAPGQSGSVSLTVLLP